MIDFIILCVLFLTTLVGGFGAGHVYGYTEGLDRGIALGFQRCRETQALLAQEQSE